MTLSPPVLYSTAEHSHLLPALAQIHADCILNDFTLATFLPGSNGKMDLDKMTTWWRSRAAQVDADRSSGRRTIIMQFAPNPDSATGDLELAGHVTLWMPFTETGPFRSEVHTLLVSPRHRQKGIARAIMTRLEQIAREEKRELLMLDTTIGSPAELVYPRLGYTRMGTVPRYGISPKDGRLVDEVWFYKDLREV